MRIIRDPATWPAWQSEIVATQGPAPLETGDEVLGKASMLGFAVEGKSDTTSVDERTFVEDVVVGVRMIVSYTVTEHAEGSSITRVVEMQLPGGPLGRLLALPLKMRLKKMQKQVLQALAALAAQATSQAYQASEGS